MPLYRFYNIDLINERHIPQRRSSCCRYEPDRHGRQPQNILNLRSFFDLRIFIHRYIKKSKIVCRINNKEHLFYLIVAEISTDFKGFIIVATFIFTVLTIPCLFSQFPPLNIQRGCETPLPKQNIGQASAVGSFLRLFYCPKNGKEVKTYGAQNHTEATDEKRCDYLQTSQSILLGKFI